MDVNRDIESVGAYIPRYRLPTDEIEQAWGAAASSQVAELAVPDVDEDAVTMAVAAAKRALNASGLERDEIKSLTLGSTTPPVDEGEISAQVTEMLGIPRTVDLTTFTQSTRDGVRALVTALRGDEPALAVATDCPFGNPDDALGQSSGAGAVACVIADGGSATVTDMSTHTEEFSGTRFRNRGSQTVDEYGATSYERNAYATVVGSVLRSIPAGEGIAPTAPDAKRPQIAARTAPFDATVYERADVLGDTGTVSPLFGLLTAWEDGCESVVVVGYGDGAAADAVRIEGSLDVDWPDRRKEVTYGEYLRLRGHITGENGGDR